MMSSEKVNSDYPGAQSSHQTQISPPLQQNQLPPGWISQWDSASQKHFYINIATGISQWNDPRDTLIAPPSIQPYQPPYQQQPYQQQPYQPPYQQPYQQQPYQQQPNQQQPNQQQPYQQPYQQQDQKPYQQPYQRPYQQPYEPQVLIPAHTPSVLSTTSQQSVADPQKPAFLPAAQVSSLGTELAYNTPAPAMGLLETVDPTVAIALELKQSIPTLRTGPPTNAKQPIKDAYRKYVREIQDYQNEHTRSVRDAQVTHQKSVQDAEYYSKHQLQNGASYGLSSFGVKNGFKSLLSAASTLFTQGTQYSQQRDEYNKRLRDAKTYYERQVEHSSQRLNDSVEQANRRYDDVIYELSKTDNS